MKYILCFLLWICLANSIEHLEAYSIIKTPYVKEKKTGFYIELLDTVEYSSSTASDINDKGEIVGTFKSFDNKIYAFYISIDGCIHVLDLPGPHPSGLKINNNSQIIGNIGIGYGRSFYWTVETGCQLLDTLSNGKRTCVEDINDLGQIVGSAQTGEISPLDSYPTIVTHACIWENNKIHDLGTLKADENLEGDTSEALSINNLGEIVGRSNYAINIGGKKKKSITKPFYWNGKMQEIPYGSEAVAINNKSNVVVNCGSLYLNGSHCTCLIWNPKKDIIYSINHTEAVDINDNDIVLFPHAGNCSSMLPPSLYYDEVNYFTKGTLYLCTTFKGKIEDIPLMSGKFAKINNRNQIVGVANLKEVNESHACILNPLNTVTGIFAY